MLIVLILFTALLVLTVNLWRSRSRYPKGPTPLPLIGNVHQMIYNILRTGGIVTGFNEFRNGYGKVFTLWLGPFPAVFISDYDVAYETHVKRGHTFGIRLSVASMNHIREGKGIIGSNGEFWQEHRRFALTTLRNFGLGRNIMEQRIMDEFWYRTQDFRKTHFKDGAIEIHAGTFFDLLVGSIINHMLVSERFEQDDEEFEKLKTNLALSLETFSLLDIFCPLSLMTSRFMKWRADRVLAPFNFIYDLSRSTIQKRVNAIEKGEHVLDGEGDDFIDAFLIKIEEERKNGYGNSFNLETLAIDVFDLWQAGQETTATTLSWACTCLLNHPRVVKEVREELLEITGGNRSLSLTDRTLTPHLNATINEVQRIGSILNTNIFRRLEEDTVIDGQPMAAGAIFVTQLSMIHTDEELFRNHTQFRPERFLENNNLEKKLIPFGIGKRSCLGESLARAELYLILGNLILNYDLEPVGDVPPIRTSSPFALQKRPPNYSIRFVPLHTH